VNGRIKKSNSFMKEKESWDLRIQDLSEEQDQRNVL